MTNYSSNDDWDKMVGFTLSTTTRPTLAEVTVYAEIATAIMNSLFKIETNITDTYGLCRAYELQLIYAQINNQYALTDPENFAPMEVDLTPEQELRLRQLYGKWVADSFEVGEPRND